jgi:hypothetical protein
LGEGRGPLVVALERGAVEADVNPVAEGEAFAVDVGRTRVAVHGTHLRVARSGDRVTIDLSEGVVSVGAAPRAGSTLGPLVTAPAHVELSLEDGAPTLAVSHEPGAVRAPVSLRPSSAPVPIITASPPPTTRPESPVGHASPPPAAVAHVEAHPASSSGDPSAALAGPPPLPAVEPNAEDTLAAAVRACMLPAGAGGAGGENVTVSMSTTLHLELADTGMVRSARFDPPVAVSVNECAAPTIYKTRFAHGGSAAISIGVTVPSSAP